MARVRFPSFPRRSLAFLLATLTLTLSCRRHAAPPTPYLAFVANRDSNTVAVVDLSAFRLLRQIPVERRPTQLATRPGHQEIWVASEQENTVSIVRFPQLDVVATIPLESQAAPQALPSSPAPISAAVRKLVFSPDGQYAFVLSRTNRSVIVVDCRARKELDRIELKGEGSAAFGTGRHPKRGSKKDVAKPAAIEAETADDLSQARAPSELGLTPDGQTLIVAVPASDQLYFIDARSRKLTGSVKVGKQPAHLGILPDGSKVFVADTGEQKISAVDVASRQVLSHIEISTDPGPLLVKPDGGEIFVLSPSSTLVIVDAFHDNVEQNFPLGREPVAAAMKRDQSVLYVASGGDGSVMAIDVQTRRPLSSTQAGASVSSLALTPDERFLLVADLSTSSLAVLRTDLADDPASGPTHKGRSAVVTTIAVGSHPVAVVVPDWKWEGPH